jgi:glycosyltransferase involved in cell wall biosynthesis
VLGGSEPGVDTLTRSSLFLLEAARRWCAQNPQCSTELEVTLAGATSECDRTFAANLKISDTIRFAGYLSHKDSLQLIRTADLLFLPMHNLPRGKRATSIPGKAYEYMATGRPILAAVPDGDARDFLSQCGTAFLCRPDDVAEMASIIDRVYQAWKRREAVAKSNEAFVRRFERHNLTRALARALYAVLGKSYPSELITDSEPATVCDSN